MGIGRRTPAPRLLDVVGGISSVVVLLAGVFLVVTLSERGRGDAGAGSPPAMAAASDDASSAAQPVPTSGLASDSPTASADPTLTPTPLTEPPAAPTPRPTRTPKPVVDPRPEGTPHYHMASGHLGETIVNDEISIRVDRAAIPATYDFGLCTRADPEYTEAFAFEITESWTRWKSVDWVFEMGKQPFVNWSEDALDYGNGQSNVLVACHRPGASTTIVIYSGPLEHTDVPEDYEWTIR